jgi:hypothetical protein
MPSVPSEPKVEIAAQTAADYKIGTFTVDLNNTDGAATGFAGYGIYARDEDGKVIKSITSEDEISVEWVIDTFPSESAAFMAATNDLIYKIAKNKGDIPT